MLDTPLAFLQTNHLPSFVVLDVKYGLRKFQRKIWFQMETWEYKLSQQLKNDLMKIPSLKLPHVRSQWKPRLVFSRLFDFRGNLLQSTHWRRFYNLARKIIFKNDANGTQLKLNSKEHFNTLKCVWPFWTLCIKGLKMLACRRKLLQLMTSMLMKMLISAKFEESFNEFGTF